MKILRTPLVIALVVFSTTVCAKMTAPANNITGIVECPVRVVCKVSHASKGYWINARGKGKRIQLNVQKNTVIKVSYDIGGKKKHHSIKTGVVNFSIVYNNKGRYRRVKK